MLRRPRVRPGGGLPPGSAARSATARVRCRAVSRPAPDRRKPGCGPGRPAGGADRRGRGARRRGSRSGEHTSELQSQAKIVCRLLLLKKKKKKTRHKGNSNNGQSDSAETQQD